VSLLARLNKPWLHFIVLGVVFFQLQAALYPKPKPIIGPLGESRVSLLTEQWRASTGRAPSAQQLANFVATELDRDMLFQRALDLEFYLYDAIVSQQLIRNMKFLTLAGDQSDAELFAKAIDMRLHLEDEVVKRRLIQMMEQRLLAIYPPSTPTEEEIKTVFESRKIALQHPPQYSFEHVFFNESLVASVPELVKQISEEGLNIQAARQLGAPFLQGHRFQRQTPEQLTRNFGKHFVHALETAHRDSDKQESIWLGPIPSAYGVHYVWLESFEPGRDAELDEVKPQLLSDLAYVANKQALRCAIATLRAEYVLIGGAAEEEGCD
jgi:parvulin-like peptidyl-prolyl isomerase